MKRVIAGAVLMVVALQVGAFAVDGKKAMYVGGTITTLKEKAEGVLAVQSEAAIVFTAKNNPELTIPYSAVTSLEYGQKAGRRVAVAVMVSPLALFSKKRNHYLTITYADTAGKEQAVVFELGKDIVRTTLTIVETRSGKDIEYQDEEARKGAKG